MESKEQLDIVPQAPDSERAIIGAILLDPSLLVIARGKLHPSQIFVGSNREIYRALLSLGDQGVSIDPLQLIEELRSRNKLDEVGGHAHVSTFVDGTLPSQIDSHLDRVIETANKRKLWAVTSRASEAASGAGSIAEIITGLEACISEIKTNRAGEALPVVCLADVEPEQVDWLWFPYIPLGKLTLLEGDPGLGKSWLTCAIAAGVAAGEGLPGMDATTPRSVLLLSAEDGLADTIAPRLTSLGADRSRVFALSSPISFDLNGLLALEEVIANYKPALVIVDPIVAYFGTGVDLHRANQTREVLARLAATAAKFQTAILCVRHLAKGGTNKAIYRGLGSIDITAAVRSVLLVGADPDDLTKRAIVQIKNNLAAFGEPVGYELLPDKGFFWTGASHLTAERILNTATLGAEESIERQDAEEFLREILMEGGVESKDIEKQRKAAGITEYALRQAKSALGVKAQREGGRYSKNPRWLWILPEGVEGDEGAENSTPSTPSDKFDENLLGNQRLTEGVEGDDFDAFKTLKASKSETSTPSVNDSDTITYLGSSPEGDENPRLRHLQRLRPRSTPSSEEREVVEI